MPFCDVCNTTIEFSDGYVLNTKQVVGDEAYWKYMLENSPLDEELLAMYAQQQAMQSSGWLLCESCSSMFSFDRSAAKSYAKRQSDPPGSGSVDASVAMAAAARAWRTKHGRFPSWVR